MWHAVGHFLLSVLFFFGAVFKTIGQFIWRKTIRRQTPAAADQENKATETEGQKSDTKQEVPSETEEGPTDGVRQRGRSSRGSYPNPPIPGTQPDPVRPQRRVMDTTL